MTIRVELNVVSCAPASCDAEPEAAPRVERLPRPDPHSGGDADGERHEVLEHEDGVERHRTVLFVARTGPGRQPVSMRLVEVAPDHDGGRHGVQHAEDADADHQLLEFVGLAATLLLDDVADAEERHEAGQQERRAQEEVGNQRRHHEQPQVVRVLVAHVAHAHHWVAVHGAHHQHGHRLDRRHQPRGQVEVLRVARDRLKPRQDLKLG